ncbi:hypothetical protein [Cohnella terricola]|uniref:Uncharacterized protein n=1 Tax=Cohnella terricola TaxID=1289167 RepID=A0A559JNH3_9BACL|nr:hypothetical protein [Cohnella terricola]TVY01432.1 hypothetical protein FPZ45_09870 [Cohnella terricola]
MSHLEMLRRRSEILRRNIGTMIIKENKSGMNLQENRFYHQLIRKWHENEHEIHAMNKKA